DRAVRSRQIQSTAIGAYPEVVMGILRNRGDFRRAQRPGPVEGNLTDEARRRIEDVEPTTIGADPEKAVARLVDSHDPLGTDTGPIAGFDRDGFHPAIAKLQQPVGHGPDPERAMAILPEGHDAFVRQHMGVADDGIDVERVTRVGIELDDTPAE